MSQPGYGSILICLGSVQPESLIILIVALVVVGPERLPELARRTGQFVNTMRHMYTNLRSELGPEFDEVEKQVRALRSLDPRRELTNIGQRALNGFADDVPEAQALMSGRIAPQDLERSLMNGTPLEGLRAPAASSVVDQELLKQLGSDLLNDDLLDEPVADADPTPTP